MLSVGDFILIVYSLVDDLLRALVHHHTGGKGLRTGKLKPRLSDSEVITMAVVGEFLGKDTDEGIWQYFRGHWRSFFPGIGDRTRFVRQAADLWWFIGVIQYVLAKHMGAFEDDTHILDGFPMTVANINRASRTKSFRGEASRGYCASKKLHYYGFHGHLVISLGGIITGCTVTAANIDERAAAWEVLEEVVGRLLGDKGYISHYFAFLLDQERDIQLWTPVKKNMQPTTSKEVSILLCNVRRRIETVIGQLAERMHIGRVRARDTWHLTERVNRKLLAHTIGMFLLRKMGIESMELDLLVAA